MKKKHEFIRQIQPAAIAIIVFLVLIFSAIKYTNYKTGLWENDIRSNILTQLSGKKSSLEKALYSRIYYTRGVSAYVGLNPGITNQEYEVLAGEYIQDDTVISSMALSKNCVLNAIFPIEGHEAAIGLNLLEHPERKLIVEETLKTGLTFVAGPVELVEGGTAFISYTPIFDKTYTQIKKIWGVTDIVIKQNELLKEAGLFLQEAGNDFALRGYNGLGEKGHIFWGKEDVFENDPVKINIELPNGNWVLAATPDTGWQQYHDQDKALITVLFVSTFIISILIGLFVRSLITIKTNEKELKAVLHSLDSLILEFDKTGKYVKVNSANHELLYLPEDKIKGRNVYDIYDKERADFFLAAIQKCLETKEIIVIEYPMIINNKERWFLARLNVKSENAVIFNAYDITEKRYQEEKLRNSEKELKDLNQTKDKFFSIIAHDLRGPVGSQKAMVELIMEEYEDLDEATRKKLISSLRVSTNQIYNLLENLLEWSMSQSGKLEIKQERINLFNSFSSLIDQYKNNALLKSVYLSNELDNNHFVWADSNLTGTIIRNLLSNAIKFSNKGGAIKIVSELLPEDPKHLKISVFDTGIGMAKEAVASLFKIDVTKNTIGTAGEKGNGLGLLLCKEFVELQGGKITVISQQNIGSIFSFTLLLSL